MIRKGGLNHSIIQKALSEDHISAGEDAKQKNTSSQPLKTLQLVKEKETIRHNDIRNN